MTGFGAPLAGGLMMGAAAALLLLVNGRIAGISGMLGRLLRGWQPATNAAFLIGLASGPFLDAAAFGRLPTVTVAASWPTVLVAGLLVGVGTRMGSGCTSGHGIMGLARLSPRSLVATATFLAAGIATATLMGRWR